MRYVKEEELGKEYSIEELKELGVGPGDIVAMRSFRTDNGPAWNYYLLKKDFPEEFDTALCCSKDPVHNPEHAHLCMLGFHWCGSKDYMRFRLISPKEKKDFVQACIVALQEPFEFWDEFHHAQILHGLVRYGLIGDRVKRRLYMDLERVHGVDFRKHPYLVGVKREFNNE